MPDRSPRLAWLEQFRLTLRVQYSDYRDSIAILMMFSLLMPLGFAWLLGGYLVEKGPDAEWFLAGNAVMAAGFGSASFAVLRVGRMRLNKEIDFYASLPIDRSAFIAGLFCLSQVSSLPGLAASMLAGHWLFHVPVWSVAAAFPLALLVGLCLAMVGASLGALAKTYGQVDLYGNLIYFMVIFLSPVIVPLERMAPPFRIASYLLPTGQGALALREALGHRFEARFWLLTLALGLWTLGAGYFCARKLDFHSD